MTHTDLLGGAAGLLIALGLVVAISPDALPRLTVLRRRTTMRLRGREREIGLALLVAVVTLLLTRLPVLAIGAAAGVMLLPKILGGGKASKERIDRLLALESWVRRLGDLIAAHAGLEQAIATSASNPPPALAREIRALAARLGSTMPIETALRLFADDLDDAAGDTVVSAFVLSSRRRGPALTGVLRGLSTALAEDIAARQSAEADREKPRATARILTWFVVGAVSFVMLDATFRRPYESFTGEVVLAVALGFLALCFVWMWRTADSRSDQRFLISASDS